MSEELPEALRAPFRACQETLTRERPLRGEDAVRATVRKMSSQEADEVAASVVRLYGALAREAARESALPNRRAERRRRERRHACARQEGRAAGDLAVRARSVGSGRLSRV